MDLLEFIASLADSLVWPVTVICSVYILRVPAGKLIERVTKLKYGELEAEFQERLNKIETIPGIKREQNIASAAIALEDLSDISPRAAVLEAWIIVEKATSIFCEAHGLPPKIHPNALFRLAKEEKLDIEALEMAYQELRMLRNKAVHAADSDITSITAKQYVKTANFIAAEFSMRAHGV